jgi:hypothetical protein
MFWPFWSDHQQKYFRPKAHTSVSLALPSVQGADAPASGSRILLYSQRLRSSSASETDAPTSGSQFLLPFQRQRSLSAIAIDPPALGSHFCSLFNTGAGLIIMHRDLFNADMSNPRQRFGLHHAVYLLSDTLSANSHTSTGLIRGSCHRPPSHKRVSPTEDRKIPLY